MAKCERGNSEKEGPFVKTLDNAFGVQLQQILRERLLATMYTRH